EAVHLASRLEQLAKPDTTVTTKETLDLARMAVRVRRLGEKAIRGFTRTVEVFELLSLRAEGSRFSKNYMCSFVGRSAELAALHDALNSADDGGSRVVLVTGEAGAGKSRLVAEFAAECRAGS